MGADQSVCLFHINNHLHNKAFSITLPQIILFTCLISLLLLTGCESKLELHNVEKTLKEPIRRTDLLQAIKVNDSAIVVVARSGVILVSSDNGRNWMRHELESWPSFIDVTSCSNGLFAALAAEDEVWISEDNGQQWQQRKLETGETPQAITCDQQNKLWVVGSFTTITSSIDGGQSWQSTSLQEDAILTGIQFFNENQGVIVGEFGTVMTTQDGGINWEIQEPIINETYPLAMHFDDPQSGWIVSLSGIIMHTSDGGQSWESQKTDTVASLFGINRIGDDLYAVGGEGIILRWQDNQWKTIHHNKPIRLHLRGIAEVDNDHFLVAGRAGALFLINKNNEIGVVPGDSSNG